MSAWSQQQQRLLIAMGYALFDRRSTLPSFSMPVAGSPQDSLMVSASARLLQYLQRAAGGADIAALISDLDALRREPARKRALWPQLRALSKNRAGERTAQ